MIVLTSVPIMLVVSESGLAVQASMALPPSTVSVLNHPHTIPATILRPAQQCLGKLGALLWSASQR